MSTITNNELLVQLISMGMITRANIQQYGLDIVSLAHSDIMRCRYEHDCDCRRDFIDWDLLIPCVKKGIVLDEDLARLKHDHPDVYWLIQHNAGIVPVQVLDDFLSGWLERRFKPDENEGPSPGWKVCLIAYYTDRLKTILREIYYGPDYIDCIYNNVRVFSGKSEPYNPLRQYSKTLDWFRRIYQLEHCYKYDRCIFDLLPELTIGEEPVPYTIDTTFETYVDTVIMLLDLKIITSSNFRNNSILTDMFMGQMTEYTQWEYYLDYDDFDTAICGVKSMIRKLVSVGIIPGINYEYDDKKCDQYSLWDDYEIKIDKKISKYCRNVYNAFNTLRGRCVITMMTHNIDMNVLPIGFYQEFAEFL